ncbi:MAG: hypothetical protein NXH91_01900 [Phyllobacteriaceae bacterium]|nr:hypothetical protein [Phyllobacteriaceae bacterium]
MAGLLFEEIIVLYTEPVGIDLVVILENDRTQRRQILVFGGIGFGG